VGPFVGAEQAELLLPKVFRQVVMWCLPPHCEHLFLEWHSLLMWPHFKETKHHPDLLRICFLTLTALQYCTDTSHDVNIT